MSGNPVDMPFNVTDNNSKFGWIAGVYVQDEWKVTDKLTVNAGLRFDQMWQYVDANQLSPRFNIVYKPLDGTTLHAGYARYFTPPPQAIAAPADYRALRQYDGAARYIPAKSGAAGTRALFRRRHRAEDHAAARGRPRRLLQDFQRTCSTTGNSARR